MTTSLDDFRNRVRATPQAKDRVNELRGMAQEVPRMEALTGDQNWDFYLRYLEANIKTCEREIATKRQQASALVLVDEAKAKAAAVVALALESRAETLRELIVLPKWIIEDGERAAKVVADLEASV